MNKKLFAIIVSMIIGVFHSFASETVYYEYLLCQGYDSDFMQYFQDGNIFTLAIGLCLAILMAWRWKRISNTMKPLYLTIVIILVLISGILMLLGDGYRVAARLAEFLQRLTIWLLVFAISPVLLIYWIKKLYKIKNIRHTIHSVRNLLLIPISIVISLGLVVLLQRIPYAWNRMQCDRYVKTQYWNVSNPNKRDLLRYKWEMNHVLQWGSKADEFYKGYTKDSEVY